MLCTLTVRGSRRFRSFQLFWCSGRSELLKIAQGAPRAAQSRSEPLRLALWARPGPLRVAQSRSESLRAAQNRSEPLRVAQIPMFLPHRHASAAQTLTDTENTDASAAQTLVSVAQTSVSVAQLSGAAAQTCVAAAQKPASAVQTPGFCRTDNCLCRTDIYICRTDACLCRTDNSGSLWHADTWFCRTARHLSLFEDALRRNCSIKRSLVAQILCIP